MKTEFEFCVIGAGMFGSAAAKYLSYQYGKEVLLIGATEPNRKDYHQNYLFGAHYDEGRITRNLDSDPIWGLLAAKSIQRYLDIERESGIQFYIENGFAVGGKPDSKYIEDNTKTAKLTNTNLETFENTDFFEKAFPFFRFPDRTYKFLLESQNAGTINPRHLVKAQISLAQKNGCTVLNDAVTKLMHAGLFWQIFAASNRRLTAKTVLICPGSYLQMCEIISNRRNYRPVANLAVKNMGTMLIRIPVEPKNFFANKGERPFPNAMIEWVEKDEKVQASGSYHGHTRFIFWMTPLKYSDGKYYLKFGDSFDFWKVPLNTKEEITNWFRNGPKICSQDALKLAEKAKAVFPDLDISNFVTDVCVISTTPTERPYIDSLENNIYVAIGGNGYGAKSSDEIGRIAALLASGKREEIRYSMEQFRAIFKTENAKL